MKPVDLPMCIPDENGVPTATNGQWDFTFWRPDAVELNKLQSGGMVVLSRSGSMITLSVHLDPKEKRKRSHTRKPAPGRASAPIEPDPLGLPGGFFGNRR